MPTSRSHRNALRRPRLEALVDQAGARRLTVLIGGAGTGKTTLLLQWLGRKPSVWHTLTPSDTSLSTLARAILEKLRLQVPDLSPDFFLAVEGGRGPYSAGGRSARADSLAAELCRELEALLTRDIYVILDDVQVLGRGGDSVRLLAALCRNAPERLHLVTATRTPLPFATSRMRLQGQAGEITADQLAFTVEEIAALLGSSDLGDHRETAQVVFDRTGGWPLAVALSARLDDVEGDVTSSAEDRATLFDYLAEEVIASETAATLDALRALALLPWVTSAMANELGLGMGAVDWFDTHRRSVYVIPAPNHPGAVSVSPLVREYLLENHPLGPDEAGRLLLDASLLYEREGAMLEAMETAIRNGSEEKIAGFLAAKGPRMLSAGLARQIIEAIERIPRENHDRELLLLEAEARQVLGDWEGATARYEDLSPGTGAIPARLAWRLGFLSHMRGDVTTALDTYRRGQRGTGDLSDEAALVGWTASAHWLKGERDEAKSLANEALDLARKADDSGALATAHTVLAMVAAIDGDRAVNHHHYLRALEHAERARDVLQTIRIRSNRSSHFLEQGDYRNALTELEIALRLADMTGFQLWRGMTLSNRAQVMAGLGRLEESVADLEQSREVFRQMGSILESYPMAQLADVYALRGDNALARAVYEEVIRLGEESQDLQALVPALAGLARVLAGDDPERAERLADRAAEVTSVIGHVRAVLAQGFVALARGSSDVARAKAVEAAELARARQDLPGLAEALELEAASIADEARTRALLEQSRRVWDEIGAPVGVARVDLALAALGTGDTALAEDAAARLRLLGAKGLARDAARMAVQVDEPAACDVSIRTLGGFTVLVCDEPVPSSAWQSKVAREIVGMLAANRGRALHREVAIERLWPDEDLAKAGNRLSVALSTIRGVLDPGRLHGSDHYLVAARESLALNLQHVEIDVDSFFKEAQTGRTLLRSGDRQPGLDTLRSAEARYLGEFLEDHPYADWAIGLREEARAEFISIARLLAQVDTESGDHDAAARWYMRILEQDAYDEPAHLGLVTSMTTAGRHGSARRLYRMYVTRMAELEVEPEAFPVLA